MRRTIEVRRGDVMHYAWRESKAADPLNWGFSGSDVHWAALCPKDGAGEELALGPQGRHGG